MRDTLEHQVVQNRLDGLTGIRGIAALWVVLLHGSMLHVMAPAVGDASSPIWTFASKGWLGVDMFFILSGFIISFVYQAKLKRPTFDELRHFWLMRLARVYPLHLMTFIAMAGIAFVATQVLGMQMNHAHFYSADKALASVVLVHGWAPSLKGFNYVSWSVSAEWFAYLMFPLVTLAIVRIRPRWANLALIAGLFGLLLALHGGKPIEDDLHPLLRVGVEFLIGCLLFNVYRRTSKHRVFDWLAFVALGGMIVLCAIPRPLISDFAVVACAALLVFSLALAPKSGGWLFSSKLAVYLGKISYAIYLVHGVTFPAFNALTRKLFPKPSIAIGLALFVAVVAVTILLAHLAWRYIEEPGRILIRRWATRAKTQKASRRWTRVWRPVAGVLLVGVSLATLVGFKKQQAAQSQHNAKAAAMTDKPETGQD